MTRETLITKEESVQNKVKRPQATVLEGKSQAQMENPNNEIVPIIAQTEKINIPETAVTTGNKRKPAVKRTPDQTGKILPEEEPEIVLTGQVVDESMARFVRNSFAPEPVFEGTEVKKVGWRPGFKRLTELQKFERETSAENSRATVKFQTDHPIGILLSSDWHIGAVGTDYETLSRDMELVLDTPDLYLVTLSNMIDNITWKDTSGLIQNDEQMDYAADIIRELVDKQKLLTFVGSPCHEGFTKKATGHDVVKNDIFKYAKDNGVPYFPNGGVLSVVLNDNPETTYSLGLAHKGRGGSGKFAITSNSNIFERKWATDIIAVAHTHQNEAFQCTRYEWPAPRQLTFVRTGAYKVDDEWGEGQGFGKGQIGHTVVLLHEDRKNVELKTDIENAVTELNNNRIIRSLEKETDPEKLICDTLELQELKELKRRLDTSGISSGDLQRVIQIFSPKS